MAGYIFTKTSEWSFHIGSLPHISPDVVESIQVDCDELAAVHKLGEWTRTASSFPNARVQTFYGPVARAIWTALRVQEGF